MIAEERVAGIVLALERHGLLLEEEREEFERFLWSR